MTRGFSIFFILFSGWVLFFSCRKIESYPVIPEIEYKSFTLRDTIEPELENPGKIGELVFGFVDGDGDIGLNQPDSTSTDTTNYNLFITMYEMLDGEFIKVDEDDLETPLNYRIPYIESEGQNKTLKGEIQVDFFYLIIKYDTIKYKFYIVDRALHKSNDQETDTIFFSQ
ncbi:hypothetical protein ES705_24506 [subsurface metagenome]